MTGTQYRVLFMGASWLFVGNQAGAAGTPRRWSACRRIEAFNANGAVVRFPVRGRDGLVEVCTKDLPGVNAAGPVTWIPTTLTWFAWRCRNRSTAPVVAELLGRVASSGVPAMSIMNMPPLAYLHRIPGLDTRALRDCYTDPSVWDAFDTANITLCSPDPQAFRPPEDPINVLQVTLPTNFKAALFESETHTAIIQKLAADVEAATLTTDAGPVQLPVKLKVHDSVFVPLAKWAMLTGNYRCIQEGAARSIRDSVHSDLHERVDCLVRIISGQHGVEISSVTQTAELVDRKLSANRKAAT